MKALTIFFIMALVMRAHAQQEGTTDAVTGTLGVTAVVGGVVSFRNFSKASNLVEANTETILAHSGTEGKALSSEEIARSTQKMEDGDNVKMVYHSNKVKNQELWVEHYESKARTAQSNAGSHRASAAAALLERRPTYTYVPNGRGGHERVKSGSEPAPNFFNHASYNNQAALEEENALKFMRQASDVRHGAPVPWMELEKEFTGKAAGAKSVALEISALIDDGGRVFALNRLPAKIVNEASSAGTIGAIALVATVASGGAAIYNYATGKISKSIATNSKGRLSDDRATLASLEKPKQENKKKVDVSSGVLIH